MMFSQAIDPQTIVKAAEGGPQYVMAAAVIILAGVVAWLAKAYREDMKQVVSSNQTAMKETAVALQGVIAQLQSMNERLIDVEAKVTSCPHRQV